LLVKGKIPRRGGEILPKRKGRGSGKGGREKAIPRPWGKRGERASIIVWDRKKPRPRPWNAERKKDRKEMNRSKNGTPYAVLPLKRGEKKKRARKK